MYCCLKQYKGLTLKCHSPFTFLFRCQSITFLNLFDIIQTLKFKRFGPAKLHQMIYVGIWNTFRKGFIRPWFKSCKFCHCYDYASNDWIMSQICTWHDSWAVVPRAKLWPFRIDSLSKRNMNFDKIWIIRVGSLYLWQSNKYEINQFLHRGLAKHVCLLETKRRSMWIRVRCFSWQHLMPSV